MGPRTTDGWSKVVIIAAHNDEESYLKRMILGIDEDAEFPMVYHEPRELITNLPDGLFDPSHIIIYGFDSRVDQVDELVLQLQKNNCHGNIIYVGHGQLKDVSMMHTFDPASENIAGLIREIWYKR